MIFSQGRFSFRHTTRLPSFPFCLRAISARGRLISLLYCFQAPLAFESSPSSLATPCFSGVSFFSHSCSCARRRSPTVGLKIPSEGPSPSAPLVISGRDLMDKTRSFQSLIVFSGLSNVESLSLHSLSSWLLLCLVASNRVLGVRRLQSSAVPAFELEPLLLDQSIIL